MSCLPLAPIEGASTAAELSHRLRSAGPEALDDAEALQAISGATPAQVAALLAEFGSLPQVLAASPGALGRCVRPAAAARLALMRIPRDRGHEFHAMVGTDSTGSWAPSDLRG